MLATLSGDTLIAENQTFAEEVIVSGNASLKVVGDLVFEANSTLRGDGTGAADNLTIDVEGSVIFRGPIGSSGLNRLSIEADSFITVADGVSINLDGDLRMFVGAAIAPSRES